MLTTEKKIRTASSSDIIMRTMPLSKKMIPMVVIPPMVVMPVV